MLNVTYNKYISQGFGWETTLLQLLGGVLCSPTRVTCDCDISPYQLVGLEQGVHDQCYYLSQLFITWLVEKILNQWLTGVEVGSHWTCIDQFQVKTGWQDIIYYIFNFSDCHVKYYSISMKSVEGHIKRRKAENKTRTEITLGDYRIRSASIIY